MKKHDFRLEAVLKLRESKEENIKFELSEIIQNIQKIKQRVKEIENDIETFYTTQEKIVQTPLCSRILSFYPEAVRASQTDKQACENQLYSLGQRYEDKVKELNIAIGEKKIFSKMKEKSLTKHKRQAEKKDLEMLEEIMAMRINRKVS